MSLDDIEITVDSDYVSLISENSLRVISSAVLNGGITETKSILNYQVDDDFNHSKPEEYLKEKLENLELPDSTVGMLTAAVVENASIVSEQREDFEVKTVVTAGITNPLTAGVSDSASTKPSTINTIVLVDGDMKTRAMIDTIRTITEAKTVALKELDLRDKNGKNTATGTATDAIVIGTTKRGEKAEYAGPVTLQGNLIGKTVRKAVKNALIKNGFDPSRPLSKRLEERGLPMKLLIETSEEAFVIHPDSKSEEDITKNLEDELKKAMKDINVASLIISGLRLEEDGKKGLIPNLSVEKYKSDPVDLLADEILGMRIANYINGSKGVFEFARIDREKPGILEELDPFLDDIIGGLIGGVCSKTYERGD